MGRLIVIAWATLVAVLTLMPVEQPTVSAPCVICGQFGGVDFLLNVVLFLPAGVGLRLAGRGLLTTLIFGFITSSAIEALQWRIVAGRDASIGDLVSNTIGALAGAGLLRVIAGYWQARGRRAQRLAVFSAGLTGALLFLAGFLLLPAPPNHPQVVMWTAPRPGLDSFPGVLEQVTLNGGVVRGGDTVAARDVVRDRDPATSVVASVRNHHGVTRRKAHIVAAANRSDEEAFFLGQWRSALVFRGSQHGSRVRLRPLMVRMTEAFDSTGVAPPALLSLEARADRHAITLVRSDRTLSVPRTIGLAWTLLLPRDLPFDNSLAVLNALALAVLVLPTALLCGHTRVARASGRTSAAISVLPLAIVGITLFVAPLIVGIAATSLLEWTGAGMGSVAGFAIGRLTSRRA